MKITSHNVMGRVYVALHCQAHGLDYPHTVWSRSRQVGAEDAANELHAVADAVADCLRAWEMGEFDFTDECFTDGTQNGWFRPAG